MPKLNGHEFDIATTTPNAIKKLDEADEALREYNEQNERNYLFDEEFRGSYLKKVGDIVLDFKDDSFNPDESFYADGDLDVGTLQNARISFLANGGMIGV